jgi:hypothetical protein
MARALSGSLVRLSTQVLADLRLEHLLHHALDQLREGIGALQIAQCLVA